MPETYINHQMYNTICAYKNYNKIFSNNTLRCIVEGGVTAKSELFTMLKSDHGLIVVERPLAEDELRQNSYRLQELQQDNPLFSFDFSHKQVTERSTGKCLPLKKFLKFKYQNIEEHWHLEVLEETAKTKTLLIAAHPWFLIGSAVAAGGENVESSCHHPNSATEDYKSGAIAYSQDSQTMIFGAWDTNQKGLIGRQLVWVDKNAPGIVVGRKYGYISETDSKFLRAQLYPLISSHKYNEWKKTGNYQFNINNYCGYMDDDYFEGYRPQKDNPIVINLAGAICPSCGELNSEGALLCNDCWRDDSYECEGCNNYFNEDRLHYVDGHGNYCSDCFSANWFHCHSCGNITNNDEACELNGYTHCSECAERKGYAQCYECEEWSRHLTCSTDGDYLCDDCIPSDWVSCNECGTVGPKKYLNQTIEGSYYCDECASGLDECEQCSQVTANSLNTTTDGLEVCNNCIDTVYTENCPYCGLASVTKGACCEECATNNLFTSDNYTTSATLTA